MARRKARAGKKAAQRKRPFPARGNAALRKRAAKAKNAGTIWKARAARAGKMGRMRFAAGKPAPAQPKPPASFLVVLTVAFCIVLAARLGALEQNYAFQKTPALISGSCPDGTAQPELAFAESNRLSLPIGRENQSVTSASFAGEGTAVGASVAPSEPGNLQVESLSINGQEICGPCANNVTYRIPRSAEGELHVAVETAAGGGIADGNAGKSKINIVMVEGIYGTEILPSAEITLYGGWKSAQNAQIPSSIYGTDAPFHLNRVRLLPDYLARLEWPYANYTFFSALAPSLASLFFGTPPEYAYKLGEIALFFLPVAIFYLFSRRLSRGSDAVFAISSFLYLCFPITGLLTGGGPDLFMYGMTAQMLATCLSLLFFLFAYEYLEAGGKARLALAALFFMLAFLSNQRIIVALGIFAFAASIPALLRKEFWRVALLAACLLFSVLWNAIPFAMSINTGTYGALGGANIGVEGEWALAVLQSGYLILPALFITGLFEARRNRGSLHLLLAAGAVMTLIFTSSAGVNRLAPFVDGVRFMPSFFLPAFFLAGMGAYLLWRGFAGWFEQVSVERKWDRVTYGGAVALAVFLPLAAMFFVVASTSFDFYGSTINSIATARDYVSQQQAGAIIGDERAFFISESVESQYPVYERNLQRTYVVDFGSPGALAAQMQKFRLRYAILGSTKHALEKDRNVTAPRYSEYLALENDPHFVEIPIQGGDRLFMLRDGEEGRVFFAPGVQMGNYSIRFDRADFAGTCLQENCTVSFYSSVPLENNCILSGRKCTASVDAQTKEVVVRGIPKGDFTLAVSPKLPDYELLLAAVSILAVGACFFFSKD